MEKQRSSSSGFGSGEGLRAAESPCGVGLGDALQLPDKDLAGAVRVLRSPEESAVRRMCGGAAPDHHGHVAIIEVELLVSAHWFLQDALSELIKIYPPLKLRVFADNITALLIGKNKVVAEMAKKVEAERRSW